ncbi:MAG: flagellar motor protein MotB, partial [Nitrospiria bacterium]
MARKGKGDDGGFDPNAWMATFSDLLSLLLTFFVLLFAMKS